MSGWMDEWTDEGDNQRITITTGWGWEWIGDGVNPSKKQGRWDCNAMNGMGMARKWTRQQLLKQWRFAPLPRATSCFFACSMATHTHTHTLLHAISYAAIAVIISCASKQDDDDDYQTSQEHPTSQPASHLHDPRPAFAWEEKHANN